MITKSVATSIVSALAILSLAACSNNSPIVSNKLNIANENGQTIASLTTKLKTANISIGMALVPIFDPEDPSVQVGQISVTSPTSTETDVTLSLNVSAVFDLPPLGQTTTLPNGTALPVLTVNPNNWVWVKAGSSSSRLYLNFDVPNRKAVVGYALGSDVVTTGTVANLFFNFAPGTGSNDVSGLAGIYSGVQKGQSGFAVFADFSSLFSTQLHPSAFLDRSSSDGKSRVIQKVQELNRTKSRIFIK